MTFKQYLSIMSVLLLPISSMAGQNNQDALNKIKQEALTEDAKKRSEQFLRAQKTKEAGQKIQDLSTGGKSALVTTGAALKSSDNVKLKNLSTTATTISAAIGTLGTIISSIVKAKGRSIEGKQVVQSADEQLVRGLEISYHKIEKIAQELEGISSKRPVIGKGDTKLDKFKSILNPSAWSNSVKDLIDKSYLTDFKSDRIAQATQLQDALKKEKQVFDKYLTIMLIKILENTIKSNIAKNMESNRSGTIITLQQSVNTLKQAAMVLQQEIVKLGQPPRFFGKDKWEKNNQDIQKKIKENQEKLTSEERKLTNLLTLEAILLKKEGINSPSHQAWFQRLKKLEQLKASTNPNEINSIKTYTADSNLIKSIIKLINDKSIQLQNVNTANLDKITQLSLQNKEQIEKENKILQAKIKELQDGDKPENDTNSIGQISSVNTETTKRITTLEKQIKYLAKKANDLETLYNNKVSTQPSAQNIKELKDSVIQLEKKVNDMTTHQTNNYKELFTTKVQLALANKQIGNIKVSLETLKREFNEHKENTKTTPTTHSLDDTWRTNIKDILKKLIQRIVILEESSRRIHQKMTLSQQQGIAPQHPLGPANQKLSAFGHSDIHPFSCKLKDMVENLKKQVQSFELCVK